MRPTGRHLLAVALGGMIGAVLRVAFATGFPIEAGRFPLTTFLENVTGAFALGLVLALLARRWPGGVFQLFLCTGILGSFTTFSGFSVEIVHLAAHVEQPALAMIYAMGSVVAGLAAGLGGMSLAHRAPGGSPWRSPDEAVSAASLDVEDEEASS